MNDLSFETRIKESVEFIEQCELGDCDHALHRQNRLAKFDVDEANPEAVVADNTVIAITAGMTKDNKRIVKDTMLFASLVANKAHPNGGVAWYERYLNVLSYCGWFPQSSGLSDYRLTHSSFTLDQVALKILESALVAAALPGPAKLLMLKVAKDTIDALREKDKPLRLFNQSSKTHPGAKFAIAAAAESSDGEVVVAMGALDFNTRLNVTQVLFTEWSSSSVHIKRAENHMILAQDHYERVRDVVEKKLTGGARQALEEFEI